MKSIFLACVAGVAAMALGDAAAPADELARVQQAVNDAVPEGVTADVVLPWASKPVMYPPGSHHIRH